MSHFESASSHTQETEDVRHREAFEIEVIHLQIYFPTHYQQIPRPFKKLIPTDLIGFAL